MKALSSAVFLLIERQSPDHGVVAEAGTHPIDGVLGLGSAAIDQIGGVRFIRGSKRA